MVAIRKYILDTKSNQNLTMPLGAKILSVKNQNRQITLWALVNTDPNVKKETRSFRIIETGIEYESIDFNGYIDTVILGSFALHVFEVTK